MNTLIQINTVANSGSTGRIAEGIGNAAMAAGYSSHIAYGRFANSSSSKLIRIGQKKDYLLHGFRSRIFDDHGFGSVTATRTLLRQMDEIQPDIVHLHNIHGYYLNYPLLFEYLKNKNLPVVWTLHDCWPFTGHCAHFDYANCDKWKNGCCHCPQKKTYPASYICDRSKQNWLDKKHYFTLPERMNIVAVSYWLRDLVKESFLGKYPVNVIYNGVDTDVFHPYPFAALRQKYGWEGQKILLGVASVWTSRKGLEDFIELAKLLPENYRIVLVGLKPEQMKDLPDNITAFFRTESVQMLAELYSAADVLLNLSYEETFGLTSVEGFSCGTPCVAYDRTASPELLADGVGLVVKAGDIFALKQAIEVLTSSDKSFYTECCRRHALANFRQEDRFQDYIDLYGTLLNSCGKAGQMQNN